jgi:hypothetical protein
MDLTYPSKRVSFTPEQHAELRELAGKLAKLKPDWHYNGLSALHNERGLHSWRRVGDKWVGIGAHRELSAYGELGPNYCDTATVFGLLALLPCPQRASEGTFWGKVNPKWTVKYEYTAREGDREIHSTPNTTHELLEAAVMGAVIDYYGRMAAEKDAAEKLANDTKDGWIRLKEGNDWGQRFIMRPDCASAKRGTHGYADALPLPPEGTQLRVRWEGVEEVAGVFHQTPPGHAIQDMGHSYDCGPSTLPYVFVGKRSRLLSEVDVREDDFPAKVKA